MTRFAALHIGLGVIYVALFLVLSILAWARTNGRAWFAFRVLVTTETVRAANSLSWIWARADRIDVNPWSVANLVTTPLVIFAAGLLAWELTRPKHGTPH